GAMAAARGGTRAAGRGVAGPSAAANRAVAYAHAVGLSPSGQPSVRSSAGAGGWSVPWQRSVTGVQVGGEGARIALWPDGASHGLTRPERPLAAMPARPIDAAAA